MTTTVETIDAYMHGVEHQLSCYFLPGPFPTLVEPGPTSSLDSVVDALSARGVGPGDLAAVVVTHVHLDHGGGAGEIARRFPNATIVVHAQGARHLLDPTRLWDSASRIYGPDRMLSLWGTMSPVPSERLRAVDEGDRIDLGGGRHLEVLYTPGHAKHLMCLIDSDTGGVFVGDAVGITLPGSHLVRPTVPPPDIDPDLLVSQLERLQARGVTSINFAHFGIDHDVDSMLEQAIRRVRRWDEVVGAAMAEGLDLDGVTARLAAATHADYVADGFSPDVLAAAEERTEYATEAAGLWRSHEHHHH
ncbi:MAG TPA: MBL fold metallo-hydrolase [Acidimicrobiales bacterium]|nr:MBL fold metallo-hydrolase [Acidimicrobiales bacterium]